MMTLEELASNEDIQSEYRKSLLLNILKKIVARMRFNSEFNDWIKMLFRESKNPVLTSKVLVRDRFDFELSDNDAEVMSNWICAHLSKSDKRKPYPVGFKESLIKKQHGKCMVCGEPFPADESKIHIDHIIPWTLVGDELQNNYQCLCESCNESKSSHTDYIFRNLINLN